MRNTGPLKTDSIIRLQEEMGNISREKKTLKNQTIKPEVKNTVTDERSL